jgi:hypothetical protein
VGIAPASEERRLAATPLDDPFSAQTSPYLVEKD